MTRTTRRAAIAGAVLAATAIGTALLGMRTEADIAAHHGAVADAARSHPMNLATRPAGPAMWAGLPEPVRRYFDFTFGSTVPQVSHVEMRMSAQFRRPLTEGFTPTTAAQTVAVGTPAMMFDATVRMVPGVWARAYDAYVDGAMEMKAKVMSVLAVVDESSSPELDRISLRRWLLESPLYPMALLPGGPVRWEAIDAQRARAVVSYRGLSASLVATFAADGRLLQMDAETDGDLGTPYHGSGEHAARSDYREVDGVMIPMRSVIARAAGGKRYPFWRGQIEELRFVRADTALASLR